jgi:NDP-sugar pyrophosphorylase family protein
VKAVVLVGGEDTRLRPLTLSTPKQMLPIVEVPMIERVLGQLAVHGVDEAVLSLGYMPDAFLDAYPDGVAAGVRLSYAVEPEPLDTAGAVRFAADFAEVDSTFVVVNGDVLTDMDISALVAFHHEHGAEGTIGLHPVDDPSAFGVVPTDGTGQVTAFVEKPPRDEAPTNLINAGTYVLEPAFLDRVPPGRRVSIERETFPAMVRDRTLYALADDSYWLDTGTPADYLQAHFDLVEGRRGEPPAPGARRLDDDLWALGSPAVRGRTVGPCFVADGAIVAEGATLERSVLGPHAVVESGASVSGSVLLGESRVAADATVAGSVLGPGATVGMRCHLWPVSVLGRGAVVASGTDVDGERIPG